MRDRRSVTIVDDDEAVRDSLRLLLDSSGIVTRDYSSADEFLQADSAGTACLLLDVHMPGTSGLELLRLLRSRGLTLPIIIVSGRRDSALDAQIRAAGATAILSKPFDESTLLEMVQQALAAA